MGGSIHKPSLSSSSAEEVVQQNEENEARTAAVDQDRLYQVHMRWPTSSMGNGLCFKLHVLSRAEDQSMHDVIKDLIERCEVTPINNDGGNTALMGVMHNKIMEKKTDRCEYILPPQFPQATRDDFFLCREQSTVMGMNYAHLALCKTIVKDPVNVILFDYQMLVYKDYVRLSVTSNTQQIYDLHQWSVLGFVIPFQVWRHLFPHLFGKHIMKIIIRSMSEKERGRGLWEYKSFLFIHKREDVMNFMADDDEFG